jgi:hypothetical protein
MRLVIDQADALAKAMLAQRGRELETRVAGAGDNYRSLRHRNNPIASAQELPMTSPHSADFGLLASSITNGARGRVPNDGGTIWPHGSRRRKSVSAQEEGWAAFCRLGGDCHLLPSAI